MACTLKKVKRICIVQKIAFLGIAPAGKKLLNVWTVTVADSTFIEIRKRFSLGGHREYFNCNTMLIRTVLLNNSTTHVVTLFAECWCIAVFYKRLARKPLAFECMWETRSGLRESSQLQLQMIYFSSRSPSRVIYVCLRFVAGSSLEGLQKSAILVRKSKLWPGSPVNMEAMNYKPGYKNSCCMAGCAHWRRWVFTFALAKHLWDWVKSKWLGLGNWDRFG